MTTLRHPLRWYQRELIDGARAELKRGARNVLVVAPTGSGKTVKQAHVSAGCEQRGQRCLTLAHRRELIRQASVKLLENGVPHGIIVPGRRPLPGRVMVGSVQTVARRLDRPECRDFDFINIDEAHHAITGGYLATMAASSKARGLGWTASPLRLDGLGLGRDAGGIFDAMVVGPTVADLMDDGFLVRAKVYGPPSEPVDLSKCKKAANGDYSASALRDLMDMPDETGDAVAHYRKLADGLPAIVFCRSVQHSVEVARGFREGGYRATAAHGGMKSSERDAALGGLATGAVQVVAVCDLVSEGLDIPTLFAVIILRATLSLGLLIQWWGRVLRPIYAQGFDLSTRAGRLAGIEAGTKPHAIIIDHTPNPMVHGLPDTVREWSLEGKPKRQKEEVAAALRCPQCLAIHAPAKSCPSCGYVYGKKPEREKERIVVGGELVELSHDDVSHIRSMKIKDINKKFRTIEQLEMVAAVLGHKEGWAADHIRRRDDYAMRMRYGDRVK